MRHEHGVGLPAESTSFVGRRHEIEQARGMLSRTRLLTLTGPGGIGKTRLALRLADRVRRAFPDAVRLADLAAADDEEGLAHTVLAAFGWEDAGGPAAEALAGRLGRRRALLVLDNCEHLLAGCAALVRTLLRAAPGLQIIATSRQALGVSGECVLPVPPLAAPRPGPAGTHTVLQGGALQLFAERAAAVLGEFAPSPAEATAAAMICHRLDGIPLAVEMAAARLRVLSCEQVLERLEDRFRLLTGGCRGALPRQRTLRATLEWSFDLCTPEEQLLWARLSVFPGSFDLEAVEAVCAFPPVAREEVLDLVAGLADKSVLSREQLPHRVRYRMLDTLRHYGRLRTRAAEEEQTVRRRHRDHYHALALQADDAWFSADQALWSARLHGERPNLRTAMRFCLDEAAQTSAGLEMAAALWSHRLGAGGLAEERRWLSQALESAEVPTMARAKAVWADGWLALLCGDPATAHARVAECRVLAERLGDQAFLAHADQLTGLAALFEDDFTRARPLLDKALSGYRACGDLAGQWTTLFLVSLVSCLGQEPCAERLAQECLTMCDTHEARWSRPYALWVLGLHHWLRKDTGEAVRLLREGLRATVPAHNRLALAQCLEVLAWARAREGHHAEAAELLGAAHGAWERVGASLPGIGRLLHHRTACEQVLAEHLGQKRFAALQQSGSALSAEQALARALHDTSGAVPQGADRSAASDRTPGTPATSLTPREQQVAVLLAEGLTDRQIAARLVVSVRTAQGHVQRILRKLGFTSRAQAAAWARTPAADPPRP